MSRIPQGLSCCRVYVIASTPADAKAPVLRRRYPVPHCGALRSRGLEPGGGGWTAGRAAMTGAGLGAAGMGAMTGAGMGIAIGGAATGAAGLLNCGGIITGAGGADGWGMA